MQDNADVKCTTPINYETVFSPPHNNKLNYGRCLQGFDKISIQDCLHRLLLDILGILQVPFLQIYQLLFNPAVLWFAFKPSFFFCTVDGIFRKLVPSGLPFYDHYQSSLLADINLFLYLPIQFC